METIELKTRIEDVLYERRMKQTDLIKLIQQTLPKELHINSSVLSQMARNQYSTVNRKHLGTIALVLGIEDVTDLLYFERVPLTAIAGEGSDDE